MVGRYIQNIVIAIADIDSIDIVYRIGTLDIGFFDISISYR